jgi:hypothetical protein
MREICSYGSVGEPVGNHRLYPEGLVQGGRLAIFETNLRTPDEARSLNGAQAFRVRSDFPRNGSPRKRHCVPVFAPGTRNET